jgi:hypothetical protein
VASRRAVPRLLIGSFACFTLGFVAGCSSDDERARSTDETAASTDEPTPPAGGETTTPPDIEASTTERETSRMSIGQGVVSGEQFTVSFSGRLQDSRGGYLWVKTADGSTVALLRSDGKAGIPMGYELDLSVASMMDDALSGPTSTFVFPAELPTGTYTLCTANSAEEECAEIEVAGA